MNRSCAVTITAQAIVAFPSATQPNSSRKSRQVSDGGPPDRRSGFLTCLRCRPRRRWSRAPLPGFWPVPTWRGRLALEAVARSLELANLHHDRRGAIPAAVEARVTRVVRLIERDPGDESFTLQRLAREAGLSPYHFLRTFHRVTGTTPHQYLTRNRLRHAATRLVEDAEPVIDVALDSGYADVSNQPRLPSRIRHEPAAVSPPVLMTPRSPAGA